jgi:hypothetical protein
MQHVGKQAEAWQQRVDHGFPPALKMSSWKKQSMASNSATHIYDSSRRHAPHRRKFYGRAAVHGVGQPHRSLKLLSAM